MTCSRPGRVKIQTIKNSQRHLRTKRLIDLSSNTPNCYLHAGEFRRYLFTGNACQKNARRNRIGAGNPANLLVNKRRTGQSGFCDFGQPSRRNLFPFSKGKNRLSIFPITHQLKFFTLRFLSRKNLGKELVLTNKSFFRNFNSIRGLRFARKPV